MTCVKITEQEKRDFILSYFEVRGEDIYFKDFDINSDVSNSLFNRSGAKVGNNINMTFMGRNVYCKKSDAIYLLNTGSFPEKPKPKKINELSKSSREMANDFAKKYKLSKKKHHLKTPPIGLLLEAVEIIDNKLVWTDFSHRILGRKSKRLEPGKQVNAYFSQTSAHRKMGPSAYLRFNAAGINFQISYGRAVVAVKTGKYPECNVWMIDGDSKNLSADNFSSDFIPWWVRSGESHTLTK